MDSQQVNESYLAGYLNSVEDGNIKSGQLAGASALSPHPTHFSFCFVLLFEAGSHGTAMVDQEPQLCRPGWPWAQRDLYVSAS